MLTEKNHLKNCCEPLASENRYIPSLPAVAKELQEKLADCGKTDTTAHTPPEGRRRKRATVADKQVIALEAELAEARDAQLRLFDASARSKADATKARADPRNCNTCPSRVEQASMLESDTQDDARVQSVELAKATEKERKRYVSRRRCRTGLSSSKLMSAL